MRTWTIGSGEDCDVVVAQPRVSGRHCRFTELSDGYLIEDLGSSNGTYVNGERISGTTRVSATDAITLGALVRMPWPPTSGIPCARVIRIGRGEDNDIVLDDPRVSGYHARLIVSGSLTLIEDTGSANGTFVNSPERRATQAIPLTEVDTVYFGSFAVQASRLLPAPPARETPVSIARPVLEPVPPGPSPARPSRSPATINLWTILMLAQSPVIAILIHLFFGRLTTAPITEASRRAVAEGIASTTFALAVSAVWLGGSLAAWSSLVRRASIDWTDSIEATILGPAASKFATLVVLCVAQCVVLLAMVYRATGLSGPWPSMFGVLFLASAVGLALGLAVFSLIRSPGIASAVLMLCFAAMIALGGRIWLLVPSSPAARIASAAPTRWAFEGLLLLESGRHPTPDLPEESGPDRRDDLAEGFFPADSERMGPKADAMALGFILIALATATAFISAGARPVRRAPSSGSAAHRPRDASAGDCR